MAKSSPHHASGTRVYWRAAGKVARIEGVVGTIVTGTITGYNASENLYSVMPDHRERGRFAGMESLVSAKQLTPLNRQGSRSYARPAPVVGTVVRVSNVTISPGVIQTVKFRVTKQGVFCTTKGKLKLCVAKTSGLGSDHPKTSYEAGAWDAETNTLPGLVFLGPTPAKAFGRAARFFWR